MPLIGAVARHIGCHCDDLDRALPGQTGEERLGGGGAIRCRWGGLYVEFRLRSLSRRSSPARLLLADCAIEQRDRRRDVDRRSRAASWTSRTFRTRASEHGPCASPPHSLRARMRLARRRAEIPLSGIQRIAVACRRSCRRSRIWRPRTAPSEMGKTVGVSADLLAEENLLRRIAPGLLSTPTRSFGRRALLRKGDSHLSVSHAAEWPCESRRARAGADEALSRYGGSLSAVCGDNKDPLQSPPRGRGGDCGYAKASSGDNRSD